MTVHLVIFSDESMSRSRELCIESARRNGVSRIAEPHPQLGSYGGRFTYEWLTDSDLFEMRSPEFWRSRGIGYWTWKPYIIDRAMHQCDVGDILIYADAGIEFINNVSHIIERMDQDIFLFGNNWEHVHWCKADVLYRVAVEPTGDMRWMGWERYGKQCQASVIFFRVSDDSRAFVAEWLKWCLWHGGKLIDDSPSGILNHPEFREHRHDQAILTTLAYREGIKLHWWPASYNDGAFVYEKIEQYKDDDYPITFNHHRRRNGEWIAKPIGELADSLTRFHGAIERAKG